MPDYVLTGLVKRRAELTGEIERTHQALPRMLLDLESLDATILQFAPDFQVEAIRPKASRPPADWADRGQMSRVAEPLTSRDIAMELLISRAMDERDQKLVRLMTKRVGARCGPSGITGPSNPNRGRGNSCCGESRGRLARQS